MASWGDINLALNRLVSEGVIATFKTNRGNPDAALGLHVIVAPPQATEGGTLDDIRDRVLRVLEPLAGEATVTVDHSLDAARV